MKLSYALVVISVLVVVPALAVFRPDIVLSPILNEQKKKEEEKPVVLVAVGDVMLSRAVAGRMRVHGMDYPFTQMRKILSDADITFANLETSITPGRTIVNNEMTFRADPESAGALARAGFDIVSLANNHTTNFGQEGLLDTLRYLKENAIAYAGAGVDRTKAYAPAVIEKNGTTFAFFAYTYAPDVYGAGTSPTLPGIAGMDSARMAQDVATAKNAGNVVVVSMHAGDEYAPLPNDKQTVFAHTAIDAGASLVIGHHPHVVQPMERYKDGVIVYSLGNFIFDQITRETQEGALARIVFEKGRVTDISFTPVLIEDLARPRILEGEEGEVVVKRIEIRN